MESIAIRRLRILSCPTGRGINTKQKLTILAELASLGYSVSNPDALGSTDVAFFLDYKNFIDELVRMRGGDVSYVPLFSTFPETPIDDNYYCKRIIGAACNFLGRMDGSISAGTRLDNGVFVPDWLFDLKEFGADPITQFQDKGLFEKGVAEQSKREGDSHVEMIPLELVPQSEIVDRLRVFVNDTITAKSAIKPAVISDVIELLPLFNDTLDFEAVTFKETKALLMKFFWEEEQLNVVKQLAKTPTDLLRMFAALTDGDVSLSSLIKFPKFSKPERRAAVSILETSPELMEDLSRYAKLWLAAARYIHPGDYRKQYPTVAKAFRALAQGKRKSFNGTTEALIKDRDVKGLLNHLMQRPGVFARKLHEMLRRFPRSTTAIVDSFNTISTGIPVKNLLVLLSYFETVNELDTRAIVTKSGKLFVTENPHKKVLKPSQVTKILDVIEAAIFTHTSQRESWDGKNVWIDPALANITVPLQQRSASDGLLTLGRGSRIPVDITKTVRLFIYWKDTETRTDLDLSATFLDNEFNYTGHVSYTNLKSGGIVHSGDIQSAPLGAAEFIDIPAKIIKTSTHRYIAISVLRFSGSTFNEIDCYAGWMLRDKKTKGQSSFDIKTVQNKFDITATSPVIVPLMLDMKTSEIVIIDAAIKGRVNFNNVEGSYKTTAALCREIAAFPTTRPNMLDLAEFHRRSRGSAYVDARSAADITIGLDDDCTIDVRNTEKVLSQLI